MPYETSFFDFTLFKRNVTRFWPIWASYLVIWVILLPVELMMESPRNDYFQDTICESAVANPWFAFFYGAICAVAVLSHLYNSRPANFYGSLPVRREGIFLTQYVSGFAFTCVPNVLIMGLTALVCASFGVTDFAGPIFTWLGTACGSMFFFYTFAFLCGLLAGHILAAPAFYFIANFLCVVLYELVESVLLDAYYGFVGFGRSASRVIRWLTPIVRYSEVEWGFDFQTRTVETFDSLGGWCVVSVYCAVAVVMLAGAFFLYRSRRLESAGDVVAVRVMRPVFKYGVAVCGGLSLGYLTSNILGEATLPYTVVIWTVVGCFLAQMLLDKTFRVFKKWRGAVAVGAVMAAAMACIVLDVTGFETWLPEAEDVESVEIRSLYSMNSPRGDSGNLSGLTVTNPGIIEDLLTIHREAIERKDEDDSGPFNDYISYDVIYHTRTGDHRREYSFSIIAADVSRPGAAANALEHIFSNRELLWQAYGFDKLEEQLASGGRIAHLSYRYRDYDGYEDDMERQYGFFSTGNELEISNFLDILEIYEAVKRDFREGNICQRSVVPTPEMESRSRLLEFEYITDEAQEEDEYPGARNMEVLDVYVTPTAKHTLEVLSRVLPQELKNQGLDGDLTEESFWAKDPEI